MRKYAQNVQKCVNMGKKYAKIKKFKFFMIFGQKCLKNDQNEEKLKILNFFEIFLKF